MDSSTHAASDGEGAIARKQRNEQRMEAASVVLLSVAALLTSWSSFQASLWDGEQAAEYSRANGTRVAASMASTRAGQLQIVDVQIFSNWLGAYASGQEKLQAFYRARLRPEFQPAFEAWLARVPLNDPNAPSTPFVMPQYRLASQAEAARLSAEAENLFQAGERDNAVSDSFVAATVIFSSTLFFGGIGQSFHQPRTRLLLLGVALFLAALGLGRLLILPIAH